MPHYSYIITYHTLKDLEIPVLDDLVSLLVFDG